METRSSTNQTNINSLDGRVGTAESDITGLETDVNGLLDDVSSIQSRTTSLEVGQSSITGRVSTVETRSSQNQSDISGLSDDLDSIDGRVAQLEITSDMIQSSVYRYGTTNLFDCANGQGWQTESGSAVNNYNIDTQKVNNGDCYSSGVYLVGGQTYCISYYGPSAELYYRVNQSAAWKNTISGTTEINIGRATKIDGDTYQGYNRYYGTFEAPVSGYYFIQIYTSPFYRPQIEKASYPTVFNIPVGSVIRQTVDKITLKADNIQFDFTKSTDFTSNGQVVMNIDTAGNLWIKGEYRGGTITGDVTVGEEDGTVKMVIRPKGSIGAELVGMINTNEFLTLGFTNQSNDTDLVAYPYMRLRTGVTAGYRQVEVKPRFIGFSDYSSGAWINIGTYPSKNGKRGYAQIISPSWPTNSGDYDLLAGTVYKDSNGFLKVY